MKVVHAISSMDATSGGTSTYLQLLSQELIKLADVSIVTNDSVNPLPVPGNVNIRFVKNFLGNRHSIFGYGDADIYHGNGLWELPVHRMVCHARSSKKPYVLSPHGMLEPWSLGVSKTKKQVALALYQRADLNGAKCIHATAESEAENIRKMGFKNPLAVIPNGIDTSEFDLAPKKRTDHKRTILFLSRIHPQKGIENLIDAFNKLETTLKDNWKVEIAGPGDESYINSLESLIKAKGLSDDIKLVGPLYGIKKTEAYQNCDLFVLPTFSENFGIVITEALACGKPVITTRGTPWKELSKHHAGWWIDIGIEPLARALKEAISLSESERQIMGRNGRKLVEQKYSIDTVAQQMITLYEWILGKGPRPEFVYI